MARKRLIREFDSLDSLSSPIRGAKVHALVNNISPMIPPHTGKKSYFEGEITDSTSTPVRVVGFNRQQQEKMAAHCDKQQPIALDNCVIQKAYRGEEMEVKLTDSTTIFPSPKRIKPSSGNGITLCQLPTIPPEGRRVSVSVEVVEVNEKCVLSSTLEKQEVLIADATGTSMLTLWQSDINKLRQGESYELKNLAIKEFNGKKHLSPPKRSALVYKRIEEMEMKNVKVAAASFSSENKYNICLSCKGEVNPKNDIIGCCTKCSLRQRLDECSSKSATLYVNHNKEMHTLNASLPMIRSITEDNSITDIADEEDVIDTLLNAQPFNLTFNASNDIKAVCRGKKKCTIA